MVPNQNCLRCQDCGRFEFTTDLDDPSEPFVLQDQSAGVNCPKCQCELQFATLHERWRVCLCIQCRGYILENQAFATIVHEKRASYEGEDAAPVPMDVSELQKRRSCPACLNVMETHPYHGPGTAVINSCQGCKVTWLDYGELASIIRAPGKRMPTKSSLSFPTLTSTTIWRPSLLDLMLDED